MCPIKANNVLETAMERISHGRSVQLAWNSEWPNKKFIAFADTQHCVYGVLQIGRPFRANRMNNGYSLLGIIQREATQFETSTTFSSRVYHET